MDLGNRQFLGGAAVYRTLASDRTYSSFGAGYADSLEEEERERKQRELANSAMLDNANTGQKKNPDGSITEDKPNFLDYLNPFGDKGLFGKENVTKVAKSAEQAGEWSREKVDDLLGEKGNDKFDNAKDVARFGLNLLPGMVEGLASSGKNIREAATGERIGVDEDRQLTGEDEELTAKQRAAAGVVGALDTVGLATGGSGKFFKEILKKPLGDAAESALLKEAGKTAGRSLIEGTEEAVQSVAQDIQDDDKLSEDWASNAAKGFALGTAAGGLLDVAGRGIGAAKDANARRKGTNTETDTVTDEGTIDAETTDTQTPEQTPDPRGETVIRQDSAMTERLAAIDTELNAVKEGTDPSVRRLVAEDGTDVTAVAENYDNQVREIETQIRDLQKQAEGVNNTTGKATPKEGVDPSEDTSDVEGRAKAAEQIPKLREKIETLKAEQAEQFEMLGGVSDTVDTKAASEKFKQLQREKNKILDWKVRNNVGESAQSLQQKLNDIQNGVVSDEFVEIREPAMNVVEAVERARDMDPDDVSEVRRASVINEVHREAARQKLDSLWSVERAREFEVQLDENYKLRREEINEMPGPKQEEALMMLDEDYTAQRAENTARVAEDADEFNAAEQALQIADQIDARITDRWNDLQESDPVAFGAVDAEQMTEVESSIDVARTLKKFEENPDSVSPIETESAVLQAIRNADDVEEAGLIIDSDERLADQAATLVADQVSAGKMKGGLVDYGIRTIRDSLRRLENGDKLVNTLDEALLNIDKSDKRMAIRSRNDQWKRAWKGEAATDQSIEYWDKGEPITQMEGESDRAFERRQTATESVKEWLQEKAEEQGLSQDQMIKDYFPHNFQQTFGYDIDTVGEAVARLESGVNKAGNKLTDKQRSMLERKVQGIDIATQERIKQAGIYKVAKNGHLERRNGAEGWSRDIPFVLEMYQRMSNKSAHMQPALDTVKSMTVDLDKKQLNFVEDALNALSGKETRVDEILGQKTTKVMRNTRRASNLALMGLSARTVALQPIAIVNNWRDAPNSRQFIASTLKTIPAAFDPKSTVRTNPLLREFLEAGGMEGSWSGSLKPTKMNKLEKAMLGGIGFIDRANRFAAYDMGKQDYIKGLGKPVDKLTDVEMDAAKSAGVAKAREAQFGVGAMDVPLAQNNEVGKMIFQLQQFNMKQFGKEVSYLYGENGLIDSKTKRFTKKGATNLIKTVAGYSAVYALYTQVQVGEDENSKNPFGFGPEDMLPFGEQISALVELVTTGTIADSVQTPIPPVISALVGRGGQDKGIAGHLYRALMGGDDIDRGEEFASSLKSAVRNFVPGGTQGVRTYEGATALDRGESMNKAGSTRFLVDNSSGWNIMKGLVAGQYATTEGQEWLRNGMNTISKKETVVLPDGSKMPVSEYVRDFVKDPNQKAQWIGFYAAKTNANKQLEKANIKTSSVVKSIRDRLTNGDISRAQASREAAAHNQTLVELYRPFMAGNKNIPKYVITDFMENILIDEKMEPYQERKTSSPLADAWTDENY